MKIKKLHFISKNKKVKLALKIIALLLLVGVVFRLTLWEHFYYKDKTGSERKQADVSQSPVAPDNKQQEQTEQGNTDKAQKPGNNNVHKVPANNPSRISIPSIGVKRARVVSIGVLANGQLASPSNNYDIGWFYGSGRPGLGGTLLLDGHSGAPYEYGVLKKLPKVKIGDKIEVERGDGKVFRYTVVESITMTTEKADAYMETAQSSPVPGTESLTVISCTGTWSEARRVFLSRHFVRAIKSL